MTNDKRSQGTPVTGQYEGSGDLSLQPFSVFDNPQALVNQIGVFLSKMHCQVSSSQFGTHQSSLLDSPKSIFGFEPISGITPGGQQLRTQRSLLAELLQATAEGPDAPEEHDDYCEEDCAARIPVQPFRPNWCTCNVGQYVPREFHARECAITQTGTVSLGSGAELASPITAPISIPIKTYYKTARQIEERQRILYNRQMYRKQQEAQEQVLAARPWCP
ncbi:hypothetical protein PLESTM_000142700 [Pleodorina starrii]|nr:hypothetical protein PLESTM_000142700 [Pleodorina starrii]